MKGKARVYPRIKGSASSPERAYRNIAGTQRRTDMRNEDEEGGKGFVESFKEIWQSEEEKENQGKGFVQSIKDMWNGEEEKHGFEFPFRKKKKREKTLLEKLDSINYGPGVGVGVGCGIGVGVGLIGGFGDSRRKPWNHLKLVTGFGVGCGLGIGYGGGVGHGIGYVRKHSESER